MKRALGLVGLALLVACGGAPPPESAPPLAPPPAPVATSEAPRVTPDAPFRQQPPAPDGQVQFTAPKVSEAKLKNGLRVLVVERHDLPIVSVRLVVSVGAGDVPDARPGVMSFLGSMLEQGTKKRSALQLSDDFEAIGAHHGAWVDWDSAGVSLRVLSERLDAGLELMADVALAPSFPEAEIERLRTRRVTAIQAERSSPGSIASNTVAAALFGRAHPYGHSLTGQEADAKKLTRAEIVRAYERLFTPKNAAIVVAGDVTQASIVPKLEAAFGGWKAKPGAVARKPPKAPAKAATDKRVVFVDRPGAQSQVQIIRPGVPHSVKDREAFVIANAILGGMFSSRVNMNLREKNAYTYGARSYFAMRHGAGPFLVAAAVFADKTGPAIKEALSELDGLRRDGPTAEELSLAKESIRLAMPGRFEGVADVGGAISDLFVHDMPIDDYEKRAARIEAVTADDVKRVALEYFGSDAMTIVVVGDKATVLPQIDALGFGAIDERDAYGNPLAAAGAEGKTAAKPAPAKPAAPAAAAPAKPAAAPTTTTK
ncbi:MAG: insulinase family protein [Labilithrix sp.]|nr:insulinase family protein [Labilithrix sp.]